MIKNSIQIILPPCDPAISVYVVCFLNMNKISKGHIGSLGEQCNILGFTVLGKGWLYSSYHINL